MSSPDMINKFGLLVGREVSDKIQRADEGAGAGRRWSWRGAAQLEAVLHEVFCETRLRLPPATYNRAVVVAIINL